MATKLYISQPMHGKSMNDILTERKRLVTEAAAALHTDDILVLDTLFINHDKTPLEMLGRCLEKMAEADAVIFALGWRDARGCQVEHLAASEYDLKIIHGKEVVL